MPSYLDLALLLIVAVSALLSMVRGFTREVLAIASWGLAAVSAYYFYPTLQPYLTPYIARAQLALIAAVAIVFFVTLILVSIITIKLSEAILDSKVGALDRSLGFIFGAARGFLLGVVAFLFFIQLAPAKSMPAWFVNARSKPLLEESGNALMAVLPKDFDSYLASALKPHKTSPDNDVPAEQDSSPAPDAAPEKHTEATPTTPAASSAADKKKLDALISKSTSPPANKKP